MTILGIDPGLEGAFCFFDGTTAEIVDTPVLAVQRGGKAKRDLDPHQIAQIIAARKPDQAFVELVGAMPGQGVSSTFAFGKGFGIVIGVLAALGVPFTLVPPSTWKKALQVPIGKDAARQRASQLLPAASHQWPLKKHDGRAEAALIALYGSRRS